MTRGLEQRALRRPQAHRGHRVRVEVLREGPRRHPLGEDLRARGVAVDGGVVERRGAFGTGPSLYLRDPDGYLIELKPR